MSKNKKQTKKKFQVKNQESIEACLARMQQEGYQPVRRTERPIFIEENGEMIPHGREIIFEAKLAKDEH
ncbi:NETI motif-containing protein [Gracilibacillus alcaliphilus]|uniref:NETI motif-containing protein n=1 Tax=Gracilibacillus alcaliphilus TaxID=1401441 RepID=UPI00195A5DCC